MSPHPCHTVLLFLLVLGGVAFARGPRVSHDDRIPPQRGAALSGVVRDQETREPLAFAAVAVGATSLGVMTEHDGSFELHLAPGTYEIVVSMIGYETKRISVVMEKKDRHLDVDLHLLTLQQAEVEVIAEDPGMAIMRRAIRRMTDQRRTLRSYSYELYTKFVAGTDTLTARRSSGRGDSTIVSIFESVSRGYFRSPDSYFNEIIRRRQSVNVPPEANYVAFGTNLNAADPVVTLVGEEVFTPFHPDALSWYEFVLDGQWDPEPGRTVNRIRVTPTSRTRKLFMGTVYIEDGRWFPVEVDLTPSGAVQLPFDAALRYRQQFRVFDSTWAMPTSLFITSSLTASLFWILAPRLDIQISTIATDYRFNPDLSDALFQKRRVEIAEEADAVPDKMWKENAVLPLHPEEEDAYRAIRAARENPDSVLGASIIDKVLGPVSRTLAQLDRPPFTGFDDVVRYNRVHGLYLGIGLSREILPRLELGARGGYGFSDARWYGALSLHGFVDAERHFSLDGSLYHSLSRRDSPWIFSTRGISLLSFLFRNDYGDYYRALGGEIGIAVGTGQWEFVRRNLFIRPYSLRFFFRHEDQRSAAVLARFAVFGGAREFRPNPQILDGRMRSIGVELSLHGDPRRRSAGAGFRTTMERSAPWLGSEFDYTRIDASVLLRTETLPSWEMDLRLFAGIALGEVPPQRFFSLESSASSFAAPGTLRGLAVKEFYGDRVFALTFEHSFGEVIPGVFRIPNLASFGLEFLLLGGIGWTEFSARTREALHRREPTYTLLPSTRDSADRWYYEAGFAISRILIFFRMDLMARLSQTETPQWFLTLGLAQL